MRSEVIAEVHSTCDEEPDCHDYEDGDLKSSILVFGSSRHVAQRDGQRLYMYVCMSLVRCYRNFIAGFDRADLIIRGGI